MNGMVNQSRPAGVARVEHGEDVRVLQPCGQLDLAQEPLGAERGRQLRVQHLERHRAVVAEVGREIDRGHAAAAELALERVSVGQGRRERAVRIRAHAVPSASFLNRGLVLSGSNAGSIRSHAGDR